MSDTKYLPLGAIKGEICCLLAGSYEYRQYKSSESRVMVAYGCGGTMVHIDGISCGVLMPEQIFVTDKRGIDDISAEVLQPLVDKFLTQHPDPAKKSPH